MRRAVNLTGPFLESSSIGPASGHPASTRGGWQHVQVYTHLPPHLVRQVLATAKNWGGRGTALRARQPRGTRSAEQRIVGSCCGQHEMERQRKRGSGNPTSQSESGAGQGYLRLQAHPTAGGGGQQRSRAQHTCTCRDPTFVRQCSATCQREATVLCEQHNKRGPRPAGGAPLHLRCKARKVPRPAHAAHALRKARQACPACPQAAHRAGQHGNTDGLE